jgi:hypothetical protein
MSNIANPDHCQCGCAVFNIETMEYDDKVIGVLTCCVECGYVSTIWRDDET